LKLLIGPHCFVTRIVSEALRGAVRPQIGG